MRLITFCEIRHAPVSDSAAHHLLRPHPVLPIHRNELSDLGQIRTVVERVSIAVGPLFGYRTSERMYTIAMCTQAVAPNMREEKADAPLANCVPVHLACACKGRVFDEVAIRLERGVRPFPAPVPPPNPMPE